ncbi:acetyltransferase [Planoprotostelium fungivorum]|uniref:Acetyltransferase n=1 Tax=Planoprotostelium fungivorum TaxID=1890364 RepID=A0A2P6P0N8_9EUKA|nr:acetyltransferase [Planoprotostelium fungivorum]
MSHHPLSTTGYPTPKPVTLEGKYVRLEILEDRHLQQLFDAGVGDEERFRYMWDSPPKDVEDIKKWAVSGKQAIWNKGEVPYAVVDKSTGRVEGRQTLMSIFPEHGRIEIGRIFWGKKIMRSRVTTESIFLIARHVFEDLGYRRLEWTCNAENEASRRAAARFGFEFEGKLRQWMVCKGVNRDNMWFSILDHEWKDIKAGYEQWLQENNFDDAGNQKEKLVTRGRKSEEKVIMLSQ